MSNAPEPPASDTAREAIDLESDMDIPGPGRDTGEVRNPEAVQGVYLCV